MNQPTIPMTLMAAAIVAWVACSESSLGLREETPPVETPPVGTPPLGPPGSPVDAEIAFVSTRDGSPRIYLARPDGSAVTPLVAGERPAWSWDGLRIAFQRDGVIYIVNADGSNERRLVEGFNPAWSPDGSRIVFDRLVGIFVQDLVTNRVTQLISSDFVPVEAPEGGEPWVGQPTWSPDGRSIAFVRGSFYEPWWIYTMNADGSEPRRLKKDAPPQSEPAWSPDGSAVAFESNFGIGTVHLENADLRSYIAKLAFNPDWSPDGGSVAFSIFSSPVPDESSFLGSRMRIFVATGEDSPVRQLIPEAVAPALPSYWDYDPAWSRVMCECIDVHVGREVSEVETVTLFPDSLTVEVYDTARLTVVVRDTTGAVITKPNVVFLAQGLMVGTVDSTGLVTGLPGGCGDGTVVASSRGVNSNTVAIHIGSPSGAGCWDY